MPQSPHAHTTGRRKKCRSTPGQHLCRSLLLRVLHCTPSSPTTGRVTSAPDRMPPGVAVLPCSQVVLRPGHPGSFRTAYSTESLSACPVALSRSSGAPALSKHRLSGGDRGCLALPGCSRPAPQQLAQEAEGAHSPHLWAWGGSRRGASAVVWCLCSPSVFRMGACHPETGGGRR